jgi:hypothetical protein
MFFIFAKFIMWLDFTFRKLFKFVLINCLICSSFIIIILFFKYFLLLPQYRFTRS